MLKLFLWLRYLRKKKIVFLSIAAVALSVSLLVVVASLFTGFIDTFEQTAVEAIGNIVINPPEVIAKYDLLIDRLEQTEVVDSATAVIWGYGLLHLGPGNVRAVDIWGIEPARRARVTGFDRFLLEQGGSGSEPSFNISDAPDDIGGFVGIGLLSKPDEMTDEYDYESARKMLGEQVVLTTGTIPSAEANNTRTEVKREVMAFSIADIIETGVYQFDAGCVYLPIEQLSETLFPEEASTVAQQIHIKLADDADADIALAVIRGVWRSFVVEQMDSDPYFMTYTTIVTAGELHRDLIAAYQQQMSVLLLIFGVISFGVVLLVFCIFYMIVRLKQKDIAIIRSCGSSSSTIAFIFVGFGVVVGVLGSGIGTILGYLITRNVNDIEQWIRIIFGLKLWKSSVYLFNKIPNQVNWPWALSIAALAIIASAIGTLIPAIVAAITKPVEILRYE